MGLTAGCPLRSWAAWPLSLWTAWPLNLWTTKLVDRLTAKLVNRSTAMLVNRLTAKLMVVNLVKLHLTKFIVCQVEKIATFLSTMESIASDFSPVIINISKIELLDTNFGFRFLGFNLTKMLHFWNLSSGQEYISNKQFYIIYSSMVIFWLYNSSNTLNGMLLIINTFSWIKDDRIVKNQNGRLSAFAWHLAQQCHV